MALFTVVRSGPEVEELGQGHQVPGLTVQEVEVFMSNLKGRGEDAQEWADIDALGAEGSPARRQRARILGRSKDQWEVSGDRDGRRAFKDLGSVLCCYSLMSSPPTPPQLPIPSESPESYVQAAFGGKEGRWAMIHVWVGTRRRKASGLKKRMVRLYKSKNWNERWPWERHRTPGFSAGYGKGVWGIRSQIAQVR